MDTVIMAGYTIAIIGAVVIIGEVLTAWTMKRAGWKKVRLVLPEWYGKGHHIGWLLPKDEETFIVRVAGEEFTGLPDGTLVGCTIYERWEP